MNQKEKKNRIWQEPGILNIVKKLGSELKLNQLADDTNFSRAKRAYSFNDLILQVDDLTQLHLGSSSSGETLFRSSDSRVARKR